MYMYAYIHTYKDIHTKTCITYVPIIRICMYTYIHTYTQTYIHTKTYILMYRTPLSEQSAHNVCMYVCMYVCT